MKHEHEQRIHADAATTTAAAAAGRTLSAAAAVSANIFEREFH